MEKNEKYQLIKTIPCLRNLEGDKLENKFNKLYKMSSITIFKTFLFIK